MTDLWGKSEAYEQFMGRWSRQLAPRFLDWFDPAPGLRWADLGCGTGALTAAILERADPASVLAIDPSAGFLAQARTSVPDPRVTFREGSVELLEPASVDVVVAGLVLNFLPDPPAAVATARAAASTVAAYFWDYVEGIQMLLRFWAVASEVAGEDVGSREVAAFARFQPAVLEQLWGDAGLVDVETGPLEMEMVFEDFDDYWTPFLGGTGPAPAYVATLDDDARTRLRDALAADLRPDPDGRIRLPARAWAVRGVRAD